MTDDRERIEALRLRTQLVGGAPFKRADVGFLLAQLAEAERQREEWRKHLGDGPPSQYASGIEGLKGALADWMHRAKVAESALSDAQAQLRQAREVLHAVYYDRFVQMGWDLVAAVAGANKAVLAALAGGDPIPPAKHGPQQAWRDTEEL